MANVFVDETSLQDIADAIRDKLESEDTYKPGEMAAAIESISSGGITPTGEIEITANGTYDVTNYASADVDVPQSGITPTGTISITQNGTADVTNYASASVNVPNSYTASDEGKVVSNGALVAQTSDTATENGTVDTTLINSLTVNVSGGGLPSVLDKIDAGTVTLEADADTITISHSLGRVPDFACIYQDFTDWTNVALGHCVIATYIRYPYANSNETQDGYMAGYRYKHGTSGNSLGGSSIFSKNNATTTAYTFSRGNVSWAAKDANNNTVNYKWMVGTFKQS